PPDSARTPSARSGADGRACSLRDLRLVDELEEDVLEGRAPALDLLEPPPFLESPAGERVQLARGVARLDDHELAVAPVTDLGHARVADELGGCALAHDHAAAQ